jgi:hypothetical protein
MVGSGLVGASHSGEDSFPDTAKFESLQRDILGSVHQPIHSTVLTVWLIELEQDSQIALQHSHLSTSSAAGDSSDLDRQLPPNPADQDRPQITRVASSPIFPRTLGKGSQPQLRLYRSMMDGFEGGDTQPLDSQYVVSILEKSALDNSGSQSLEDSILGQFTKNTTFISSEKPAEHGDTGFVDLMKPLEGAAEKEISPESQFRIPPVTPAAGRKRDYRGQAVPTTVTPATVTPGRALLNALGETPDGVSLTQMFHATQHAATPSEEDNLRSDPVFGRPSPNIDFMSDTGQLNSNTNTSPVTPFPALAHPISSSPVSSPTKPVTSDPPRPASEPKNKYTTMKESQERRQARPIPAQSDDESSDDELLRKEAIRLHTQARKKRLEAEIRAVSVPRSSGSEPVFNRKGRLTGNQQPPDSHTRKRSSWKRTTSARLEEPIESPDEEHAGMSSGQDDSDKSAGGEGRPRPITDNSGSALVKGSSPAPSQGAANTQESRGPGRTQPKRLARAASTLTHVPASLSQTQQTQENIDGSQPSGIPDSQPPASEDNMDDHPPNMTTPRGHDSIRNTQTASRSQVPDSTEGLAKNLKEHPSVYDTSSIQPVPLDSQSLLNGSKSQNVPSSPPRLQNQETLGPERTPTGKGEVKSRSLHAGEHAATPLQDSHRENAIPETDQIDGPSSEALETRQKSTNPTITAPTEHLTKITENTAVSPKSSPTKFGLIDGLEQQTRDTTPSSFVSPIRRIGDIANDASQDRSLPIDVFDLQVPRAEEDEAFFNAISSPQRPERPRKRLKTYRRSHPFSEPSKETNRLPRPQPNSRHPTHPSSEIPDSENLADDEMADGNGDLTMRPPATKKANESLPENNDQQILLPPNGGVLSKRRDTPEPPPTKRARITSPTRDSPDRDVYEYESSPPREPEPRTNRRSTKSDAQVLPRVSETQFAAALNQPEAEVVFPNRVFAVFKDMKNHYYPATCIGEATTADADFKIRFDDGSVDDLPASRVKSLQLKDGDSLKVDQDGFRVNTYIVAGFKDRVSFDTNSEDQAHDPQLTDVYGHQTVLVKVRPSKRTAKKDQASTDAVSAVSLARVYLPQQLFNGIESTSFTSFVPSVDPATTSRGESPSASSTVSLTPRSRRRVKLASLGEGPRNSRLSTSNIRASTVSKSTDIFANMTFTLSIRDDAKAERSKSTKLIRQNGGQLLEDGFHRLFPDLNHPVNDEYNADQLQLTPSASNHGFTALICSKHCCTIKYFQALALSIPCLHYYWLRDSVAAGKALPWSRYLLPAGESDVLDGAVRSRILPGPYEPVGTQLKDVLRDRPRLLQGCNVVFLDQSAGAPKTANVAQDRRKAYLFLTYALGANKVRLVKDLDRAREVLEGSGNWNWVFVAEDASEARAKLFPERAVSGKKRKRLDGEAIKVVDETFVKQSLILGELLDA